MTPEGLWLAGVSYIRRLVNHGPQRVEHATICFRISVRGKFVFALVVCLFNWYCFAENTTHYPSDLLEVVELLIGSWWELVNSNVF